MALELYFKLEPGQIHAKNPKIIKLSEVLNKLPIHEYRPDQVKFRNPNGVGLKLSNFLAIDPNYEGKGMESYSKLDKQVFDEFVNNKINLSTIASKIKKTISNENLRFMLYKIEDDDDQESFTVKEGKVIYKLHKHIERNSKINKKKKEIYLKKYSKLDCEVCGFDFYKKYGELGNGFIECHHRTPLHDINEESETSMEDLALVCANCHRMLHRGLDSFTVQELKNIIEAKK
ncbi:HNH endonuclease [Winogradskyella alexanderae]|uniref:HNH endonuclease n=1 Tax=Winogradskyella alexanderae TaxID=2877123 RepID=A0ABS7XUB3_9FLAO|nr:HNH endonuclease [Winogradskyella alexanderae]MCA0132606.1 HNH endonuclease [Winogradskyella alexanderae]